MNEFLLSIVEEVFKYGKDSPFTTVPTHLGKIVEDKVMTVILTICHYICQ